MYNGPPQHPAPPAGPAASTPRRSTGRTIAITVAATLGAYALVIGGVSAVMLGTGADTASAGPEFEGLPTQPCAAAGGSRLGSLSAHMPQANHTETYATCQWIAEYGDGTDGTLTVRFQIPTDTDNEPLRTEDDAREQYETESERLRKGEDSAHWPMEILDIRDLDLGDESIVSHFREGADDPAGRATVLVRSGALLVSVEARESWHEPTGDPDFTGDEETLIGLAEDALSLVE
ncbi:hypothetical protein [Nocardiopsis sp. MG754419]|uniref:hypothetical protein n=1 Tax=Nocardiopsis sp. MG754419 TaxID=2259865 RepID=UPI001BA8621B|nr:hypothetical protein [Nocardiopsis sp. MG754419]